MRRYLLGIFISVWAAFVWADKLTMPQDLVTYARENGCSEIEDFFDRDGQVNPPYVYGLLPGNSEDSAAIWCANKKDASKPYLLLFMAKDKRVLGCPDRIRWEDYPGGLSIRNDLKLALSDFWYAGDIKQRGPQGAVTNGNVIVSYYDGIYSYFYCYRNRWLNMQTD